MFFEVPFATPRVAKAMIGAKLSYNFVFRHACFVSRISRLGNRAEICNLSYEPKVKLFRVRREKGTTLSKTGRCQLLSHLINLNDSYL